MKNQTFHYSGISGDFYFGHNITNIPSDKDHVIHHHHDNYEIFYLIKGDITYYIEGQTYKLQSNDLLIINNMELHRPYFDSNSVYERIVLNFSAKYISAFNSSDFNLLDCFEKRKLGCHNKISSEVVNQYGLKDYLYTIGEYAKNNSKESSIMILTMFVQLLVKLNSIYLENHDMLKDSRDQDKKTAEILKYINENLEEKLTLDNLGKRFFVNKYYLCHVFKKNTGFTLQEYITYKRVLKAKELLSLGIPVLQVSNMVGFGDYSNFLRVFKKIVGQPPKAFLKK